MSSGTWIRKLLLTILVAVQTTTLVPSAPAEENPCFESVKTRLVKEKPEETKEFFKLQARLTLHRLAWAHLKSIESQPAAKAKEKLTSVETTISSTIQEFNENRKNYTFAVMEKRFTESPLSRRTLADVIEPFQEALRAQGKMTERDAPFTLHLEDIHLLSILAETESTTSKTATRFYTNRNDPRSILNLVKIINSSYTGRDPKDVIAKDIPLVEKEIREMEAKLKPLADLVGKVLQGDDACIHDRPCADCRGTTSETSHNLNILSAVLSEDLKKNKYHGLRWGDVWLRTARAPIPPGKGVKVSGDSDTPKPASVTDPKVPATPGAHSPAPATQAPEQPKPAPSKGRLPTFTMKALDDIEEQKYLAARNAVNRMNEVHTCIEKALPTVVKNPSPYIQALAALNADRSRVTLDYTSSSIKTYLKTAKNRLTRGERVIASLPTDENAVTEWEKRCPELKKHPHQGRKMRTIHDLRILELLSSGTGEQILSSCGQIPEQEKLLLQGAVHVGILKKDEFKSCEFSEKRKKTLGPYIHLMKGVSFRK